MDDQHPRSRFVKLQTDMEIKKLKQQNDEATKRIKDLEKEVEYQKKENEDVHHYGYEMQEMYLKEAAERRRLEDENEERERKRVKDLAKQPIKQPRSNTYRLGKQMANEMRNTKKELKKSKEQNEANKKELETARESQKIAREDQQKAETARADAERRKNIAEQKCQTLINELTAATESKQLTEQENIALKKQIDQLKKALAAAQKAKGSGDGSNKGNKPSSSKELEQQIKALEEETQRAQGLEAKLKKYEQKNLDLQNKIVDKDEQITDLTTKLNEQIEATKKANSEIRNLTYKIKATESNLKMQNEMEQQALIDDYEDDIRDMKKDFAEREKLLNDKKDKLTKDLEDVEKLKNIAMENASNFAADNLALEEKIDSLQTQLNDLHEKLSQQTQEAADEKKDLNTQLTEANTKLDDEKRNAAAAAAALEIEIKNLKNTIDNNNTQIAKLEEIKTKYEGELIEKQKLLSQIQTLQDDLNQQLTKYQKLENQLKLERQQAQAKEQAANKKYTKDMGNMQSRLNNVTQQSIIKINDLKAQITKLKDDHATDNKIKDDEIKRLNQLIIDEKAKLKADFKIDYDRLTQENTILQSRLDDAVAANKQEKERHATAMEQLRRTNGQKLTLMENKYLRKEAIANENFEKQKVILNKRIADLESGKVDVENKLSAKEAAMKAIEQAAEDEKNQLKEDHARELKNKDTQHATDMEQLKNKYEDEKKQAAQDFENEKKLIISNSETRVANLTARYKNSLQNEKADKARLELDFQAKLATIEQEKNDALAAKENEKTNAINTVVQNYENEKATREQQHTDEIDNLKKQHQKELDDAKAANDKAIEAIQEEKTNELSAQKEKYEGELEDLRQQQEEQINGIIKKNEKAKNHIIANMKAREATIKQQFQEQLNAIAASDTAKIAALQQKQQEALNANTEMYKGQIAQIEAKHKINIDNLTATFNQQLDQKQKEIDANITRIDALEQIIIEKQLENCKTEDECKDKLKKMEDFCNKTIADNDKLHEDEKAALESTYKQQLAAEEQKHAQEMAKLESENASLKLDIDNLKSKMADLEEQKDAQISLLQDQVATIKKDMKDKLADKDDYYNKEIAKLTNQLNQLATTSNADTAALTQQIATLNQQHEDEIKKLKDKYKKKIAAANAKADQEKSQLNSKINQLTIDLDAAEKNRIANENTIKDLQNKLQTVSAAHQAKEKQLLDQIAQEREDAKKKADHEKKVNEAQIQILNNQITQLKKDKQSEVLAKENEIGKLYNEIIDKKHVIARLASEKKNIKKKNKQETERLKRTNQQKQDELQEEIKKLESKIGDKQDELDNYKAAREKDINDKNATILDLKKQITENEEKFKEDTKKHEEEAKRRINEAVDKNTEEITKNLTEEFDREKLAHDVAHQVKLQFAINKVNEEHKEKLKNELKAQKEEAEKHEKDALKNQKEASEKELNDKLATAEAEHTLKMNNLEKQHEKEKQEQKERYEAEEAKSNERIQNLEQELLTNKQLSADEQAKLQKEINDAKKAKEDAEEENKKALEQRDKEHDEAMNKLEKDRETEVATLNEKIENLKAQQKEEDEIHQEAMKRLQAEQTKNSTLELQVQLLTNEKNLAIAKQEEIRQEEKEKYDTQLEEEKEKVRQEAENEYQERFNNLAAANSKKYADDLEVAKQDYKKQLKEMETKTEEQIENAKEKARQKIKEIEDQIEDRVKKIRDDADEQKNDALENQANSFIATISQKEGENILLTSEKARLEAEVAKLKQEKEDIEISKNVQVSKLRQDNKKNEIALKNAFTDQVRQLQTKHQDEIIKIKDDHREEVLRMEKEKEDAVKAKQNELDKEYNEKITQFNKEAEEAKNKAVAEAEKRVTAHMKQEEANHLMWAAQEQEKQAKEARSAAVQAERAKNKKRLDEEKAKYKKLQKSFEEQKAENDTKHQEEIDKIKREREEALEKKRNELAKTAAENIKLQAKLNFETAERQREVQETKDAANEFIKEQTEKIQEDEKNKYNARIALLSKGHQQLTEKLTASHKEETDALRTINNNLSTENYKLQKANKDLTKTNKALEDNNEQLTNVNNKLQKENNKLRTDLLAEQSRLEAEKDDLLKQKQEAEKKITIAEAEIANTKQDIKDREKRIKELEKEQQKANKKHENEIKAAKDDNDKLQNQLKEAEKRAQNEANKRIEDQARWESLVEASKEENKKLKAQNKKAEEDNEKYTNEKINLVNENWLEREKITKEHYEKQINKQEKKIEDLEKENQRLRNQSSAAGAIASSQQISDSDIRSQQLMRRILAEQRKGMRIKINSSANANANSSKSGMKAAAVSTGDDKNNPKKEPTNNKKQSEDKKKEGDDKNLDPALGKILSKQGDKEPNKDISSAESSGQVDTELVNEFGIPIEVIDAKDIQDEDDADDAPLKTGAVSDVYFPPYDFYCSDTKFAKLISLSPFRYEPELASTFDLSTFKKKLEQKKAQINVNIKYLIDFIKHYGIGVNDTILMATHYMFHMISLLFIQRLLNDFDKMTDKEHNIEFYNKWKEYKNVVIDEISTEYKGVLRGLIHESKGVIAEKDRKLMSGWINALGTDENTFDLVHEMIPNTAYDTKLPKEYEHPYEIKKYKNEFGDIIEIKENIETEDEKKKAEEEKKQKAKERDEKVDTYAEENITTFDKEECKKYKKGIIEYSPFNYVPIQVYGLQYNDLKDNIERLLEICERDFDNLRNDQREKKLELKDFIIYDTIVLNYAYLSNVLQSLEYISWEDLRDREATKELYLEVATDATLKMLEQLKMESQFDKACYDTFELLWIKKSTDPHGYQLRDGWGENITCESSKLMFRDVLNDSIPIEYTKNRTKEYDSNYRKEDQKQREFRVVKYCPAHYMPKVRAKMEMEVFYNKINELNLVAYDRYKYIFEYIRECGIPKEGIFSDLASAIEIIALIWEITEEIKNKELDFFIFQWDRHWNAGFLGKIDKRIKEYIQSIEEFYPSFTKLYERAMSSHFGSFAGDLWQAMTVQCHDKNPPDIKEQDKDFHEITPKRLHEIPNSGETYDSFKEASDHYKKKIQDFFKETLHEEAEKLYSEDYIKFEETGDVSQNLATLMVYSPLNRNCIINLYENWWEEIINSRYIIESMKAIKEADIKLYNYLDLDNFEKFIYQQLKEYNYDEHADYLKQKDMGEEPFVLNITKGPPFEPNTIYPDDYIVNQEDLPEKYQEKISNNNELKKQWMNYLADIYRDKKFDYDDIQNIVLYDIKNRYSILENKEWLKGLWDNGELFTELIKIKKDDPRVFIYFKMYELEEILTTRKTPSELGFDNPWIIGYDEDGNPVEDGFKSEECITDNVRQKDTVYSAITDLPMNIQTIIKENNDFKLKYGNYLDEYLRVGNIEDMTMKILYDLEVRKRALEIPLCKYKIGFNEEIRKIITDLKNYDKPIYDYFNMQELWDLIYKPDGKYVTYDFTEKPTRLEKADKIVNDPKDLKQLDEDLKGDKLTTLIADQVIYNPKMRDKIFDNYKIAVAIKNDIQINNKIVDLKNYKPTNYVYYNIPDLEMRIGRIPIPKEIAFEYITKYENQSELPTEFQDIIKNNEEMKTKYGRDDLEAVIDNVEVEKLTPFILYDPEIRKFVIDNPKWIEKIKSTKEIVDVVNNMMWYNKGVFDYFKMDELWGIINEKQQKRSKLRKRKKHLLLKSNHKKRVFSHQ